MTPDTDSPLREIRWTRSDPPGQAASDQERRAIYVAALQQFEELLTAAHAAGPASRPLPLFYALSQAGRAIVAAYGTQPRSFGHGLAEKRESDPAIGLLDRVIERRPSRDGNDTFGAVARATASGDFEGAVPLGALWVANPAAPRLPLEHWRPDWRLAIFVDDSFQIPSGAQIEPGARMMRVLPFAEPAQATVGHGSDLTSGRYPTVPPRAVSTVDEYQAGDFESWRGFIKWAEEERPYNQVAPRIGFSGGRYLLPTLPGERRLMSPLLLWWALLFGFSIFARYHPELWVETLNVDRSSAAVGIEQLLSQALRQVPELVQQALIGDFYPIPEDHRLV